MDIDKVKVYCEGIGHLNASVTNRDEEIKKNVKYLNYLLSEELETVIHLEVFNEPFYSYEEANRLSELKRIAQEHNEKPLQACDWEGNFIILEDTSKDYKRNKKEKR